MSGITNEGESRAAQSHRPSQIVGKFKTLDECKAAAQQPQAGGAIPGFTLQATWGGYWYCAYTSMN